jgi:cytosolic carboxypeptidase protein 2/3
LEEQAKPIKDVPNISFVPDFAPSLKTIFTAVPTPNIVYERVYPDTPRQQDKTSYFLTVLYNVKRLVYLQKNEDEIYEPNKKQEAYVPYYKLIDKNDKTLLFESKFESGNLAIAIKVSDFEYDLYMQNDINTFGHTQWFFFRVENTIKGREVKFNIKNFLKKDSLFNNGMKVRIHSHKKALGNDIGWTRGGKNIIYYANGIKKTPKSMKTMYSLTFTYTFEYDNDVVHFAYDKPFTYSEHLEMLNEIEKNPAKSKICTRRKLCRSIARNRVDYITITDRETTDNKYKRKGVLLTARMHPGEVVGSWMINGAIEFLTSSDPEADLLRKHLVFKIIPMLNPDGVVNGNYRCSLAGCDHIEKYSPIIRRNIRK